MSQLQGAGVGAVIGFLAGASLSKARPSQAELSRMSEEQLETVEGVRVLGGLIGAAVGGIAGWYVSGPLPSGQGVGSAARTVGRCEEEGYAIMHCDIYNCPSSWGCGAEGVQICEELRARCPDRFSSTNPPCGQRAVWAQR